MKIKIGNRELLQKPKRQIDKRQRNKIIAIVAIVTILGFLFFNIGKGVYESTQISIFHRTSLLI